MEPAVETCCICAEPFDSEQRLAAIGKCNHTDACSLCYLRLRVLLNDLECVVCRERLDQIYVWKGSPLEIRNWDRDICPRVWGKNAGPNYVFDERSMMFLPRDYSEGFVVDLQRSTCHTCGALFNTLKQLQVHLRKDHNGQQHCNVCLKEKKVFLMEHRQYEIEELKKHMFSGDEQGFTGHPFCKFCKKRMYDDAQLYEHLTKDHFKCHLCEGNKYFKDYKDLEDHFRVSHFLCENKECLSMKFQVFATNIGFHAHIKEMHPGMKPPPVKLGFRIGREGEERKEGNRSADSNGEEVHEWAPENFGALEQSFRRRNSVGRDCDFPSLSSEPARAMASWVGSGQALHRTSGKKFGNEEFPALTAPKLVHKIGNRSQPPPVAAAAQNSNVSSFRNALMPYPTPAMVAAGETDQWTYTMPPTESSREIQLGHMKVKRSNKNRKNRRKVKTSLHDGGGVTPSPVEKTPLVMEGAVATIPRLLGDEDFQTFRMMSLSFRAGEISALDFYHKAKEVLPEDQFLDLFMPLVQSLPDCDKANELEVLIAVEASRNRQGGPDSPKQQVDSPELQSGVAVGAVAASSWEATTTPVSAALVSGSNNHTAVPVQPQAFSSVNNEEERRAPVAAQSQKPNQQRKGGGNTRPGSASTWASAMQTIGNLPQKGKTGISIVRAKDSKSRKAANEKVRV